MLRVGTPDFQSHFWGVVAWLAAASVPALSGGVQHISPAGWISNCMYMTPPCKNLVYFSLCKNKVYPVQPAHTSFYEKDDVLANFKNLPETKIQEH